MKCRRSSWSETSGRRAHNLKRSLACRFRVLWLFLRWLTRLALRDWNIRCLLNFWLSTFARGCHTKHPVPLPSENHLCACFSRCRVCLTLLIRLSFIRDSSLRQYCPHCFFLCCRQQTPDIVGSPQWLALMPVQEAVVLGLHL